ncbi:hypothetical protein QAD02_003346 [Eretmocerus hayati]|uniref:Uncharacterized protein n=1 Tax=Eretmocerus hayati TaxID=131215 RepID=A0ACC2NPB7_9HYME|nr:hypothetical protein QAD02_003346 [Eretmocerus hayati]
MTDIGIPESIVEVVSLGPKYSHSSRMDTHTTIEAIKNVEKLLGTFPFDDELATIIRSNVVENIHSHSKKQKKHIKYEDRLIAQKIKESKEFSKENEVLFTMAD